MPHFILPIEYHEDAKKPAFIKRMMSLTQEKMIRETQVSEVLERKSHFVAESEEFQRKCRGFQEEVEASFDTLHQSLYDCLVSGIQEAKAHIRKPATHKFWRPQENLTLLKEVSGVSGVFKAMEKQLNDAKTVLQMKCSNVSVEFEADEAQEYRKNQEKLGDYEGFQARESTLAAEKKDSDYFTGENLPRFAGEPMARYRRTRTTEPSRIQICLTALIIMIAVPVCLWGWPTMQDAELIYPNSTSKDKLMQLGFYNGGHLSSLLISNGPVLVETGYYKGQWEPKDKENSAGESHISGYGTMAYHSGDIYEGYWKKGQRHGNGRLITALGDVCEGIWLEGEFSSWGKCTYADGINKSGQWNMGKLQGLGQIISPEKQSLGTFENGLMEGVGLQYVNASTYSVGNWSNDAVIGPGLEYNTGDISLRKDVASPVQKYWIDSVLELCVKRHHASQSRWEISSSGTQVEAVSFTVSKPISLTAVGIGNSILRNSIVEMLQIRNGTSTSASLLYSHEAQVALQPLADMHFAKIQLERHVLLQANTHYSLLVKYSPGSKVFYFPSVSGRYYYEGGVKFIFSSSSMEGSNTGVDNSGQGPLRDFYFERQAE